MILNKIEITGTKIMATFIGKENIKAGTRYSKFDVKITKEQADAFLDFNTSYSMEVFHDGNKRTMVYNFSNY